jgi:hypothetical protein
MARKHKNTADIESQIAALQVQLAGAREAEQARKWNELARLLKRAGALDDALAWARSRTTKPRHEAADHDE